MPPYRCVFLDSHGAALAAIELVSEEEAAAVALASDVANAHGLELWDGPKLVKRLAPKPPRGSYGGWQPGGRFLRRRGTASTDSVADGGTHFVEATAKKKD